MYWKAVGPMRFKMNNIINFGGKYIYTNGLKASKYRTMCDKMAIDFVKLNIVCVVQTTFTHLLLLAVAFYMIVYGNTHVSIISIEIPFFESDSDTGYLVNLAVQLGLVIVSMVAMNILVIIVSFAYDNFITFPELIAFELCDLEDELISNGFSLNTRLRFRNLLIKVRDFIWWALFQTCMKCV